MNKVVSINLNGNAFQLEEPGYAALSAYLEQAKAKLADNPDRPEIMADIEQAIADKLSRFLSAHKSVVMSDEVDTIIKEMGPVDGGEAETDTASSTEPKRLYRIPEGEILGGVATGFAAYFNVDVMLIRILMVVLLIVTGGGFVFGYLLGWIFIPAARTPEDRAKAYGAPSTAEEIIARTREAVQKGRAEGMKQWKTWKQQRREERRAQARAYKYQYAYDYQQHRSGFGDLFGMLVVIFFLWLGYHHVAVIHEFLDSAWWFVERVGQGIAQLIVAVQK